MLSTSVPYCLGNEISKKYLKDYVKFELEKNLKEILKEYPTLDLVMINTNQDHVHLQIEISPDISVAAVVRILKSKSSFAIKKKFKFIREIYLDGSIWSVGYFSSTVGLNEKTISKYIQWQGKQDSPQNLNL